MVRPFFVYTNKGNGAFLRHPFYFFEKVLELNPGNQDVIKRIEELKK